ncbi:MAG: LysR substrate-binding domain-containing protein [Myxococcota bacterium]
MVFNVYSPHSLPDDIRLRPFMFSRFVCLLRRGHPALERKWTLKQYAELDHILVSPRGRGHGIVDLRLAEHSLQRRVSHRVVSFSSAPPLVASSDCVLTISEHIADVYETRYELVRRSPPLDLAGFTVSAAWHARTDQDPELQWLLDGCMSLRSENGEPD